MLKPIRREAHQVVDGRKFATRSIVLTHLSAIDCYVFRRTVEPVNNSETRNKTVYPGAVVLSANEEHATKYVEQGYARMLFDHFSAGTLHSDGDDVNVAEAEIYAQIEPFEIENYGSPREMLRNIPEWQPKKGDIFALIIDKDTIKWLECVGITAKNVQSAYGDKYILNVRDSLDHLEPFISQDDLLKPESNVYPLLLSDLIYTDAPIFEEIENDVATQDDNEVRVRKIKIGSFIDQTFENNLSVVTMKSLSTKTSSPYYFAQDDAEKITVSLEQPEIFKFTSDTPVNAVLANGVYITYLLAVIDHPELVRSIREVLDQGNAVKINHGEARAFDILPINFDEVRNLYTAVIMANLEQMNTYTLVISESVSYQFGLDLTGLIGA